MRFFTKIYSGLVILCLFISGSIFSETYYVSPTGDNDTGDGSYNNPWMTPKHGCETMNGGDTLILKDGTYTEPDPGRLTCRNQLRPKSGIDADHYTIIKAENDWKAIIDWTGCGTDSDGDVPVRVYEFDETRNYIQIEGLKFINATSSVYTRSCSNIKLKRLAVISSPSSGTDDSGYAEPYVIAQASQYVLLEDSWASGCIRYGVLVIGDNGNAGGEDAVKVIIRRVVIRMDYKYPGQPKGCFSAYGGNASNCGSVDEILFQNCIAIDWNPEDGMTDIYGGFYNPKFIYGVHFQGCIALNLKPGGSGCHGFYVLDNYEENIGPVSMTNCVSWDVKGMGIYWDEGGTYDVRFVTATADQCTLGNSTDRYAWDRDRNSLGVGYYDIRSSLTNSIIDTADDNDTYIDTEDYNCYNPASLKPSGATYSITSDNGLLYPTRVEAGTSCKGAGEGGKDIGANIIYRYGEDGTLWKDTGYDILTNETLWPWPYEEQIRSDFRTQNDPKGPDTRPQTNDTTRGFCADGMTLSKYIWEYFGNDAPEEMITPENESEDTEEEDDGDAAEIPVKDKNIKIVGSTDGKGTINPSKGDTAKVYFNGTATGTFECRVVTVTGELVWQDTKSNVESGFFEWIASNVSSGTYLVHVKGPGVNSVRKIIIIE